MTDWKMYFEIQKLKALGYKKTKVAQKMNINFRTVDKCWKMNTEKFQHQLDSAVVRTRKPDEYREDMIEWLTQYPDMTAAQIGILAAIVVYLAAMVYVGFYFFGRVHNQIIAGAYFLIPCSYINPFWRGMSEVKK